MRRSIEGCPGEYESKTVVHTVKVGSRVLVIDHVPAEVCDACGDVLFTAETVRHIEAIVTRSPSPVRTVPLFEYA